MIYRVTNKFQMRVVQVVQASISGARVEVTFKKFQRTGWATVQEAVSRNLSQPYMSHKLVQGQVIYLIGNSNW